MNCPRCTKNLSPKVYEGIEIDYCDGCGGTWLDAGEIQPLVETRDVKFSVSEVTRTLQFATSGIPEAEIESTELCPKCSAKMTPMNYNYSSGVIVDICPSGHGLWFDKAEMEKAQIHFEHWNDRSRTDRKSWAALTKRAEMDLETDQEAAREKFRSQLGPIARALDAILSRVVRD